MRRLALALCIGFILSAGCGKARPYGFGADNRPLAQEMEKSLEKKDKNTIKKLVDMADSRLASNKITPGERAVLKACMDYADPTNGTKQKTDCRFSENEVNRPF